jgi:hypothetical protein
MPAHAAAVRPPLCHPASSSLAVSSLKCGRTWRYSFRTIWLCTADHLAFQSHGQNAADPFVASGFIGLGKPTRNKAALCA